MSQEPIIVFDTTLRDGEQSPGCAMTLPEKLRMAKMLDALGVDVIEAGFPIASPGDFEAVNEIAKLVKNATVCGLSRAKKGDIEAAGQAIAPAERRRIHTFISTSPLHMKYKLKMEPEAVLEAIDQSVRWAREYTDDVEWSAEDASRTEPDFLCRAVEVAIKAGASTINVPDTVGYAVPEEYAGLFRMLLERVPGADDVIFSTHCHNDLGLAVANSLAGVQAGARQIECTINGIGERAGNAALEEVVMAMRTRPDMYSYTNRIETTRISKTSKTLSAITGFSVQPNKAIVGANAFAHASGIHQDGVLKNVQTYEIMTPESVGVSQSSLVMAKHSGRHAFKEKLKELGFELGDNALQEAFDRFKRLADKKKQVFEDDLIALVEDEVLRANEHMRLGALQVSSAMGGGSSCTLSITMDGQDITGTAEGNGAVDAIFKAIRDAVPRPELRLKLYQVHAITGGTDAQAEVTVRLGRDGSDEIANGQGADPDTLIASAKAYVNALNKMEMREKRTEKAQAHL